jgi:branched-chain amino acid transport system substrate-binding protein
VLQFQEIARKGDKMEKIGTISKRWFREGAIARGILIALALLIFIGPPWVSQAQQKEEVKTYTVGNLAPLTGPAAGFGIPYYRTVSIVFKEVNEAGGIKIGNTRYMLDSVGMDDKYTPAVGIAAIEKLIGQGINVIIGTVSTPVCLAAVPISTREKVIMLTTASGPRDFTNAPYMFRSTQDWGTSAALAVSEYTNKAHPEWKKWVLLGNDSEVGYVQVSNSAQALYRYKGMEVYAEFFARGTLDFMATITKVKKINPDAIEFCGVPPGEMGLCIKQMREAGLNAPCTSHTTDVGTMLKVCKPEYLEGYISSGFVAEGPAAHPQIKEYRAKYEAAYGVWDELAAGYWVISLPLIRALKETKSLNSDDILYALEHLGRWKYLGIDTYFGGGKTMGRDHQLIPPIGILEVRRGVATQVSILPGTEPMREKSLKEMVQEFGLHTGVK